MDFHYALRIFFLAMSSGVWWRAKADLFTAIAHMEPLLSTQKNIIDNLDDYIEDEENRLAILKKHLNRYKKEHILASKDISDYLENPINAFTLIKRLTNDLDILQNYMLAHLDYVKNIFTDIPDAMYPTSEDLFGAIHGLTRLQQIYRLDIGEFAEGRLTERYSSGSKDAATSLPMTASDCHEIGLELYADQNYHNALLWMMESLRKISSGDDLFNITEVDVLEYISFVHYQLGDITTAIEWSKKLLILHPEHPEASANVNILQEMEDENKRENKLSGDIGEDEDDIDDGEQETSTSIEDSKLEEVIKTYEALCRGEIDIPSEIQRRLKCSYLTKNHPFLKLAPIKMEQIYITPDVFLFHEVMNDEEIEHIKNLAEPYIIRAQVIHPVSGEGVAVPYRISKVVGLQEDQSEVLKRVKQRTSDFTGFSMETAERLQVANYGIGGHYEPHFDFHMKDSPFVPDNGERIATVMFYGESNHILFNEVKFLITTSHCVNLHHGNPDPWKILYLNGVTHVDMRDMSQIARRFSARAVMMSDVAQGGATVFTELGLTVFPIKNSALFWLNLLPSGEGDVNTRHAACPVLRGSKWASNKWIHNFGQELIMPCSKGF